MIRIESRLRAGFFVGRDCFLATIVQEITLNEAIDGHHEEVIKLLLAHEALTRPPPEGCFHGLFGGSSLIKKETLRKSQLRKRLIHLFAMVSQV